MGSGHLTWGRGVGAVICAILTVAGTAWAQQQEKPAAKADADFPPLKVIEFDVVDLATNKPLEAARLTARVTNQRRQWTTGEDGHARLDVDGDAKLLSVLAEKDGYVTTAITWAPGQTREPLPGEYLLKLERATTIGGRVTDEAGQPIAGAEVQLSIRRKGEEGPGGLSPLGEHTSLSRVTVKTDPDGRWRFDGAPARIEPPQIQLTHPDYQSDAGMGRRAAPPEEKLRDQSAVMIMTRGISVAGRVVDPDGKPIAGAQVTLGAARFATARVPTARSKADGSFVLLNCRPGQQATLIVKANGWAPGLTQFPLEKSVEGLELKLGPAQTMRIRVVDSKGQPIAGANVRVASWRGILGAPDWRATTGPDGRAVWNEAPADEVRIGAYARGYIQSREQPLKAGDQERVITLLSQLKVTGTVVDDTTGQPVERYRAVSGWTSNGRTTPFWSRMEGEVTQTGPGAFEYTETTQRDGYALRIEAAGYLPAESRVIKPEEENVKLEFRLKKGKDLVATLRSTDGRPLAGADVILSTEGSQVLIKNGKPTMQTFALRTKADEAGKFRLDPQAGNYSVIVLHDLGYAQLKPEQFTGDNPEITIAPWGTVRGTAWVGSKPAAGRTVSGMDGARGPYAPRIEASAVVDQRGQFVLDRVPPGTISLGIQLVLQEDAQGMRVTWTQQRRAAAEPGKTVEIKLGGTGRAVVGRLDAGAGFDKPDWRYADVRITSKSDVQQRLPTEWPTMTPEARQKWLEDWAKSPDGIAARNEREGRRSYPGKVSPDGTFRIEDVEAGSYQLSAQLERPPQGDSPFRGRLVMAAGSIEITVPEMPGGRSDQPLDAGKVELRGR